MELKEFIVTTVKEIIEAVAEIQLDRTHYMQLRTEDGKLVYPIKSGEDTYIEFDIAVTLEEKDTKKGKAEVGAKGSIFVVDTAVNLNGEAEKANTRNMVNRINFKIPVIYPKT